ncbi:MAG: hypothetical protein HQL56_07250 [Magnetococcales bacterium]|nr:hypothetical protein [Magnetococcales bacterium]
MLKSLFTVWVFGIGLLLIPVGLLANEEDCTEPYPGAMVKSQDHKCFDPDLSLIEENPWPIVKSCLALQKEGEDRFKQVIPCLMQGIDHLGPNLMTTRTLRDELPKRLKDHIEAFDEIIRLIPVSCQGADCTMPREVDLDLERTRHRIFILEHLDPIYYPQPADVPCNLLLSPMRDPSPQPP